ncbi:hypothetical protein L2E82_41600 [Cichorium intybus]|uniref:Uncharacterized protein n=1 Tax=Cichorium intybus TaxID=13427 RepID=A0ACB9AN55_CICIN|nr:hypothetical protein L2E82_41600 [Cichorium intybus]
MEAISTPVSSISVPKIHPKTHQFYHLKLPLLLPYPHGHVSTATAAAGKTPTSISNKTTTSYRHNFIPTQSISTSQPNSSPTQTSRNAATGYAAALIDSALCSNSLDAVHKDVKRLLNWLQCNEMLKGIMTDPSMEESVKGRVVTEVSEKAKFRRPVVALLKMLAAKNISGIVAQVMEEFERIYHELNSNLRVVG